MKKLLSLLLLSAFISIATFAQTPAQQTSGSTATTQNTRNGVGVKKDGTPDKRYKMNKAEKPAQTGPMKKDGTPDKRYKANKATSPKM
ncbi:MAG: hypothetical protein EOP42_08995 [Sphingobacteriaceae bacterium]|nr:MAG: hypothetical protein EOP42_08995 [Sphingobacteriaceae bacterium]